MTITYPRQLAISNARMSECWFELLDNVAVAPYSNGNFLNRSQVNDPDWRGTFQTPILERSENAIWSAWKKSLRGGIKTFIAYDVRRSTPLNYPTAKVPADIHAAWDGTCTVTSVGVGGALGLATLPLATYQFKAGDRVGLEQTGHYGYYEILEDVTASASAATVTVAPFLHASLFTTSAVARLWRPWCQFMIDQQSYVEQGIVENTPISFNGVQLL